MAQFTVRVELHDAKWSDYDALHAAMERNGFSRQIKGDDGQSYELPWAEYDAVANISSMEVLAIAQRAASTLRLPKGKPGGSGRCGCGIAAKRFLWPLLSPPRRGQ